MKHIGSRPRTGATISLPRSRAGEVTLAAKQVQVAAGTTAHRRPSIIVWAGQVASRQSDPVLALDYAERVLADKRAKPYEIALRCNARSLADEPLFAALRAKRGSELKM